MIRSITNGRGARKPDPDGHSHIIEGVGPFKSGAAVTLGVRWAAHLKLVGQRPSIGVGLAARPEGFEPPTPGSEDQCSIPLSYGRVYLASLAAGRTRMRSRTTTPGT